MAGTDDQLLTAVSTALAGNLGASMQEIADEAGVGRTTLHRRFPSRQALMDAVAQHALDEADRIMTACGVDDRPVAEVLDRLAAEVLPLALTYALLWAEPPITERTPLEAEVERLDDRFERFAVRGQADGLLRPDVPARWIVYSLGSQALAVWWGVRSGFVGPREAERLFGATTLDGLRGPEPASG